MHTEDISIHDLHVGDVVLYYGMVLRVNTEPQQTAHQVMINDGGVALATRAVIDNWDEIVTGAANGHDTFAFIASLVRGELNRGAITEPRWTIQSNGRASWARRVTD